MKKNGNTKIPKREAHQKKKKKKKTVKKNKDTKQCK